MKKVLFATTALVMTAGVAAAEVTLSGFAEVGIMGGDAGNPFNTGETQFFTDIDGKFIMSGTTDNGLTFGATLDFDETDGSGARGHSLAFDDNSRQGGETYFISGAFGTVTWGDADGAFDWALTEIVIGGSIGDANTEHVGYSPRGNAGLDGFYDGQIMQYEYVLGDLAFAGSLEIDDTGVGDAVIGLGVKYGADLGGVNVRGGIGYQTVDNNAGVNGDIFGVSLDARFQGGFRAIVNYSDLDGVVLGLDNHWGVVLAYTMDAWTFAVNYGERENVAGATDDGYGLTVNYDLGGGAELQAGYGSNITQFDGVDDAYWDFGLALSF